MAEDETLELVWRSAPTGVTSCERVSRPGGLCGVGPPLGLGKPLALARSRYGVRTTDSTLK